MPLPPPPRPWRVRLELRLQAAWRGRGGLACSLLPLAGLFGLLGALHRGLYRLGLRRARHPGCPVVVVGNRIVGGAGKTPTTLAVVAALQDLGWRPGIVSRGHGRREMGRILGVTPEAEAETVGDEALLMRLRSGVPVWVGRDRAAAADALRAAHPEVDVIVADDGLQHLRLARDVELLVFDRRGAGNGWLLPAGPLREPLQTRSFARRACRVIYSDGRASTALSGLILQRRLSPPQTLADWWARQPAAPAAAWAALREGPQPLAALAGIAHPERYFEALRAEGLKVDGLPCADHDRLDPLPWPPGLPRLLLTEKDAVKIRPERLARERPGSCVWVTPLDLPATPELVAALHEALGPPPGRGGPTAAP
ncbi:tetraacyldisaccharide 4'-kinase [Aquariibacter albus]|uniref:Tetraacyldisaccharide 4'-kinase n=1 Tax=Aquariibacter albus TaxID=2759899 RepID=A0A839HQE1_9BURK|nr:tetraacyldisaccharide 4'-kinase [Aquariibacter albus]MBB1161650.1 tetraacyldisaccharide 4'-kinase [Aquariibacter albus]